jgi:hypothetical protein
MSTISSQGTRQARVWPETVPGKWSVVSFGIFLLGAIALFAAAVSGQTGGENLLDNLWLGIPGIVGLIGATVSMISGLIAVLWRRERSTVVVLTATASTLTFLFVALTLTLG